MLVSSLTMYHPCISSAEGILRCLTQNTIIPEHTPQLWQGLATTVSLTRFQRPTSVDGSHHNLGLLSSHTSYNLSPFWLQPINGTYVNGNLTVTRCSLQTSQHIIAKAQLLLTSDMCPISFQNLHYFPDLFTRIFWNYCPKKPLMLTSLLQILLLNLCLAQPCNVGLLQNDHLF